VTERGEGRGDERAAGRGKAVVERRSLTIKLVFLGLFKHFDVGGCLKPKKDYSLATKPLGVGTWLKELRIRWNWQEDKWLTSHRRGKSLKGGKDISQTN